MPLRVHWLTLKVYEESYKNFVNSFLKKGIDKNFPYDKVSTH